MFWKKKSLWNTEDPQFRYYFGNQDFQKNHLLADQLYWSIDRQQAQHNGHVFMLSGAHDANQWLYSNILQANSNYVIPDFDGEIYADTYQYLEKQGYQIHVVDLRGPDSINYNPLLCMKQNRYPHPGDVHNVASTFIHSSAYAQDPFFKKVMENLMLAILYYMRDLPAEQCNMDTIYTLLPPSASTLRAKWNGGLMAASENDDVKRALAWVMQAPGLFANEAAAGVLDAMKWMYVMPQNTLNMNKLTTGKHAVYLIHKNEEWHPKVIALFYTQLLDILYAAAEHSENVTLEQTWLCMVDQWQYGLAKRLATASKYNIRFVMRYHDMATLQHEYPHEWDCISGGCDALIYMNSNGCCDYDWVTEMLRDSLNINAKEDAEQVATNELKSITPEECIVFVRGKTPFRLKKLRWSKHPNASEVPMR